MEKYKMIVEDSAHQLWAVRDEAGIDHEWMGIAVKRTKQGFQPKSGSAGAKERLIRKAATRIAA
jgi:hypothetical protein